MATNGELRGKRGKSRMMTRAEHAFEARPQPQEVGVRYRDILPAQARTGRLGQGSVSQGVQAEEGNFGRIPF